MLRESTRDFHHSLLGGRTPWGEALRGRRGSPLSLDPKLAELGLSALGEEPCIDDLVDDQPP